MALNYSHRPVTPVFPPRTSEDNLWSPMRMVNGFLAESVPERNAEGYARPWHVNRGETEEWPFNFRGDGVDHRCCSSESNSKDIVDLLPSDPFGMDIETTFTAISGWLEDLEVGYGGYLRSNNTGTTTSHENYGLFAEWNLIWNNALTFQPFHCNNQFKCEKPCDEKLNASCDKGGITGCSDEKLNAAKSELQFGEKAEGGATPEGMPDEALVSILSCLGIKDLLLVERVCKSLCSTIRNEPWLWRNIYIDQPLSERITDDTLLQLASRADGKLQCLSLVECPKVTDDGIRRVLEMNPHLTKVSGLT
ncbi:F-box protein skip14 [Phtheirospermum japonicum]|uniref:F-box protein skip14 n=1 Tax=Phtheirospermum japonicum TaxID=374723 RepID=A0A830BQL9_9LAMI|nr:F-box protein skip14 [Phtheirospermum japonicum]